MKAGKKYFIQQYLDQQYLHGGIGYVDAEKILLTNQFTAISFPHQKSFSLKAKISRLFFLVKTFFTLRDKSTIVFIYPLYARMDSLLIRLLLKRKASNFICIVGDINGLKDGDKEVLKKDIACLNRFTYFIVHNENMRSWINKTVPGSVCEELVFFDFLANNNIPERTISFNIVFAGNLEKSLFLNHLSGLQSKAPSLYFHLYGAGISAAVQEQNNVTYHGAFQPYAVAAKVDGSFGLLWDGDSIETPGGSLGEYMQYISHHKLSLYIVSGLPIIVPVETAAAILVEKYHIGFAVKGLHEIEEKINALIPAAYLQMQQNMQPLAERISKGQNLTEALQKIMQEL